MISKVDWDSEQFGLKIGRLQLSPDMAFDIPAFKAEAREYQLVYVFSDKQLDLDNAFYLADSKVVFSKSLDSESDIEGIFVFDAKKDNYDKLLQLAYLSGVHSRFKTDPGFVNNEFEHLYKIWLDKSLRGEIADYVLLIKDGEEIAGFVTLKIQSPDKAIIGLIAVDESFRGRRIASRLIEACETLAIRDGVKKLEVPTQFQNKPAMALYKKINSKSLKFNTYTTTVIHDTF